MTNSYGGLRGRFQLKVNVFNLGTDEYCEVNESIGWAPKLSIREDIALARARFRQILRDRGEATRLMKRRRLTQTAAAKLFGVTQPRISDLVRGKIELFSIDGLVSMLTRAGVNVRLDLHVKRTRTRHRQAA